MRSANLFIAGAAKCGTTALFNYLSSHPNIFGSMIKEPHFFAPDIAGRRMVESKIEYHRLFALAKSSHQWLLDASVHYLFSKVAIPNIRDYNQGAKIILMIRNPIEQAISFHSQRVFTGNEDVTDFEAAWRLQERRSAGQQIPSNCDEPKLLQYRQVAALGTQLERALKFFPAEQIRIIVFDDFVNNTRRQYQQALGFLGVTDDGQTDFPIINPRKQARFGWAMRLDNRLKGKIPLQVIRGWRAIGLRRLKDKLLQRKSQPPQTSASFKKELVREFEPEVDKLSRLLGRNLDPWKQLQRLH